MKHLFSEISGGESLAQVGIDECLGWQGVGDGTNFTAVNVSRTWIYMDLWDIWFWVKTLVSKRYP